MKPAQIHSSSSEWSTPPENATRRRPASKSNRLGRRRVGRTLPPEHRIIHLRHHAVLLHHHWVRIHGVGDRWRLAGNLAITPDGSSAAARARMVLLGLVGVITMIFAFGIQAADNAWLLWHDAPLVEHYRATLTYRSAVIGDGMIIPVVNALIVMTLLDWGGGLRWRQVIAPSVVALGVTAAVHWYQASHNLINWTMPHAYQWTAMGYYHAAFMWSELSILAFFIARTVHRLRAEGTSALADKRLGLIVIGLWLFVNLLMGDYRMLPGQ